MPGIDDWWTRPYVTIQKLFEENEGKKHEELIKQVQAYYTERLDTAALSKIPSMNTVPLDQLKSGSLVKYRCMVQDVFDPQYCVGQYKVTNTSTQTTRIEFGSFRDVPNLFPNEDIDFDSENAHIERLGFYCVPIPGESEWVKEAYGKKDSITTTPSTSGSAARSKRGIDDEDSESETLKKTTKDCIGSSTDIEMACAETSLSQDRQNPLNEAGATTDARSIPSGNTSKVYDMNMPLPDEKGIPCIVKVYASDAVLKTTDAVEFVGILSVDPSLASIYDDDIESDDVAYQEELQAHEPPPSLVPRIHALVMRPLHHNNPSLPPVPQADVYKIAADRLMEDAYSLRLELLSVLGHALLCDSLAAEYVLCHLISSVYARADTLPLGKLCLNISGCPVTQRYTKFLHHLISQLTTQTALLEMSIDNMNSVKLIPKKDYKVNRITAGMLQLAAGTHLVIDETALQQGQLNHTGVSNVKALADVINWQKVDYDFQWHPIPVPTDIHVLTLSEGESLLPKDIHIPLAADGQILDIPSHFSKLDSRLTPENLDKLRAYITACRLIDYTVSEETQKLIQDDFVETRQNNPKDMSIEDLQRLLGLIRVLALSFGKGTSTSEMWLKVKAMEEERKRRISQLSRNTRATL